MGSVVFDLDGTLVAGDAFGRFLRTSWLRSPWRALPALVGAPLLILPGQRARAELLVIASTTFGRHPTDLTDRLRRHAAVHCDGRRIEIALARLAAHRQAGDEVVVATACAEPLARLVCAELGLPDVELVASPYVHRRWLPPRATAIRGQAKVEALQRAGIRLPVDHAYSDSLRDLPLLRSARTAHLVRPRTAELGRLRAALGDVEVLL